MLSKKEDTSNENWLFHCHHNRQYHRKTDTAQWTIFLQTVHTICLLSLSAVAADAADTADAADADAIGKWGKQQEEVGGGLALQPNNAKIFFNQSVMVWWCGSTDQQQEEGWHPASSYVTWLAKNMSYYLPTIDSNLLSFLLFTNLLAEKDVHLLVT